jgi:hypothetical protein
MTAADPKIDVNSSPWSPCRDPGFLSPCLSQGLAVQLFLCVVGSPICSNAFYHQSLPPISFLLISLVCLEQKKLNRCQVPIWLMLVYLLYTKIQIFGTMVRLSSQQQPNLRCNRNPCLVQDIGDEESHSITQTGWAFPRLLLCTHFEAVFTTLSHHSKHIQSHCTVMKKIRVLLKILWSLKGQVSSHTYHQEET